MGVGRTSHKLGNAGTCFFG